MTAYRIEPLGGHDRSRFSSGNDELDRYFHTQAGQERRRRVTTVFVAVDETTDEVIGFYTLAATSVPVDHVPEDIVRKLPRYPLIPAVLIGRLAVRRDSQAKGLGGELLYDAMLRALKSEIGVYAAIVDPKNDQARTFYERHGFQSLNQGGAMFLPLAAMERLR